jgi:hypothetical protein
MTVMQPVLLRRTGRPVIGWSAWGGRGVWLAPAGSGWLSGLWGDAKRIGSSTRCNRSWCVGRAGR